MHASARAGLVLASYLLFSLSNVHANPVSPEVVSGSADFHTPSAGQLHITAGDQTIINWQQFSINTSELTKFIQPSATSSVLNRVTGSNLSELLGTLEANGKVFLINPQGVLVGSSAVINTASFTATTFDISDAAFLAGGEMLFKGDSTGKIVNYGLIKASSGDVILIGRFIENHGTIEAKEGLAALAAGQEILLKPTDQEKIFIRPSGDFSGTAGVDQKGFITALQVELKADGAYAMAINHQGTIKALKREEIDGKVFLTVYGGGILSSEGTILAPEGAINISNTLENATADHKGLSVNLGTLDVSGLSGGSISIVTDNYLGAGHLKADGSSGAGGQININATLGVIETSLGSLSAKGAVGGKIFSSVSKGSLFSSAKREAPGSSGIGGEVHMLGSHVTLAAATIDASGSTGGGTVLIGGDFQGGNPSIMNAMVTYVNEATVIKADALLSGNGGKVIVWSDDKTEFYGSISAQAGKAFGDGGMIEISGKETLQHAGIVSASSPKGIPGSVLFDPQNIEVNSVTGVLPQFILIDPNALSGSGFGAAIVPLGNGNVVITKPSDGTGGVNAGAVYLYNGYTGALISTLLGGSTGDTIGAFGVTTLTNGNYVIKSASWDNGLATNAGAATWGSGITGVSGVVSASNSLVGTQASDFVGNSGIATLSNGNYSVASNNWNNGAIANAGAATWGNGTTGITGTVSVSNSLVGTTASDFGSGTFIALSNGNYVINNRSWSNGVIANAGAVTWVNGTTGITGAISVSNSLVGTTAGAGLGNSGIATLNNGNYVVLRPLWNNGAIIRAGAVTWGNGTTGITGTVSVSNSLVGTQADDSVGISGIATLSNGNYIVASSNWTNGAIIEAGAVTWGNGTTGITGTVSVSNSLVGTTASDFVGSSSIATLSNGNYVVGSEFWDNGAIANAGAATWGNGTTGITGTVSVSNSLVGTTAGDGLGISAIATVNNGNYVVLRSFWDNGAIINAGAATWGNGVTGITGTVSVSNSLVGTTASDFVGNFGITTLSNGNYVVVSTNWDNGAIANAGAATWGNGTTGITGTVSVSNSLVGTTASDVVGIPAIATLSNGNYVVVSSSWDNGAIANAGAVTWGNATTGITGTVSISNSLIGSTVGDAVGTDGSGNSSIFALTNGNYVVGSLNWTNGLGAATWGSGATGITGAVSISNSLVGSISGDNIGSFFDLNFGGFFASITTLTNGNYVVGSSNWTNGSLAQAGAATWGSGATGITGTVSISNSVVGSSANDYVSIYSDGFSTSFSLLRALADGNYVVGSSLWDNGAISDAGAVTAGFGTTGITGTVSAINSLVGVAFNDLSIPADDTSANGSFLARFPQEGAGRVSVGLFDANQLTFSRGQASTMTIQPSLLTTTLNSGTAVTLQASNDITITSPITANNPSGNGGNLTLAAGRTLAINANITTDNGNLTLTANDLLSSGVVDSFRSAGNATLTLGNNVVLNAGTGNITLNLLNGAGKTNSGAGDLSLGTNSTVQTSGSGIVNINSINNIQLAAGTLIQSTAGVLQMIAGNSLIAAGATTIQTTTGDLILVVDNDFPTAPLFGTGAVNFPLALLSTSGGKLVIFTAERSLNTQPAVINGTAYVPGTLAVNTTTEQWGTYYPHFSGIPFTIFYKTPNPISPNPSPSVLALDTAMARLFFDIAISEYPQWLSLNDQLFLTDPAYFFSVKNWDPLSSKIPFSIQYGGGTETTSDFLQKEPFRMHTRGPIDQ